MWRPAHIHVKVRAGGFRELTTQLYFKGDPFNQNDFGYLPSLELDPTLTNGIFKAEFDFVLIEDAPIVSELPPNQPCI